MEYTSTPEMLIHHDGFPDTVTHRYNSTGIVLVANSGNNRASVGIPPSLISKSALGILFIVNTIVIIFFISLAGSIVNLINIIVFIKQGLKDPITITLLVLSVVDFGSVFFLWLQSMFMILHFFPDTFKEIDPRYLTAFTAWPHSVLVRVSCFLTVFIALERWVCVTFPLHANRIITATVAKVYNLIVTGTIVGTFVSMYYYCRLRKVFIPWENKPLYIVTFTPEGIRYTFTMSSIVTSVYLSSFFLLVIFTVLTIIKLNRQAKWRQSMATSAEQMDAATLKNKKVVKMVVVICLLFIMTTIPSVGNTVAYMFVDGYREMSRYNNLYTLVSQICFTLEVSNSTANFFIYFIMSSNYSSTLHALLRTQEKKSSTKMT